MVGHHNAATDMEHRNNNQNGIANNKLSTPNTEAENNIINVSFSESFINIVSSLSIEIQ
jgi:hypothetical protein